MPAYENTLPGITSIATPIAKSTPVTQASHIPVTKTITEGDIVQRISSEKARAAHLENQMTGYGVVYATTLKHPFNGGRIPYVYRPCTRRINTFL